MKETRDNQKENFITLQFTLFDTTGHYKPLSTLVKVESLTWFKEHREEIKTKAIQQICNQRHLTGKELAKLGYSKLKVRNYTLYQKTKNRRNSAKEREENYNE